MIIAGMEWSKEEIEKQIKYLNKIINHHKKSLKQWKMYLKEVNNGQRTIS